MHVSLPHSHARRTISRNGLSLERLRAFTEIVAACGPVFVLETKGRHLKHNADTSYKRSVFDLCTELAEQKNWSECAPTMRGKTMRFEVVDEDEWQNRLNQILAS